MAASVENVKTDSGTPSHPNFPILRPQTVRGHTQSQGAQPNPTRLLQLFLLCVSLRLCCWGLGLRLASRSDAASSSQGLEEAGARRPPSAQQERLEEPVPWRAVIRLPPDAPPTPHTPRQLTWSMCRDTTPKAKRRCPPKVDTATEVIK